MARLTVRVTPRSSRDEIVAVGADGVVRVRVAAPPVNSAANAAVVRLLADALGASWRDIVLVSGASSRTKVFDTRLSEADLAKRLHNRLAP